ncbi:carbon-nitrogen hydrolase family protein [Nocardioides dongxiaopingii]|uniref:carbon-nitrogen hydrolase family protein n=1 Tax=Nocardioides dongxiaopingii TaxID=2576036 RepID=UPI001FE4B3F0|nr:carbon-nitrogen hydrolase family protein [Nocardioides dongxiaopingii]
MPFPDVSAPVPADVLRLALVQEASGLDPAANRARLAELTPPDADLVVWPEAWARDFGESGSDVSPYAEQVTGPFGTELTRVAAERDATVVAGMFETSHDAARPFNTLLVRGAETASYRKVHLYDSFGYRESDRLLAGAPAPVVVTVGGWAVGLMTCYDLRFPEMTRLLVDAGAEVVVVPAAWVAGPRKVDHWRTLVRARAIENTVFVAAVGQPAPRYTGHSLLVDPMGDVLAEAGDGAEVLRGEVTRATLEEARRTNPSLANRRL